MRFLVCLFALLALLLPEPGVAAEKAKTLLIGDLEVQLGEPEKKLMPRLRKRFEMEELRPGLFQALDKQKKTSVAGIVQFRDGELVWASRDLGSYEGESLREFGRALFDTLEKVNPDMEQKITLVTQREGTPSYSVGIITLKFPDRQLVLYVGRDGGAVDMSMEEILAPEEGAPATAPAPAEKQAARSAGEEAQ